jgi:hypothetical protein
MPLKAQRQLNPLVPQDAPVSPQPVIRPLRLVLKDEPKLDAMLQAEIGQRLRAYYAELMSEPVPQRFAELLQRLDRKH